MPQRNERGWRWFCSSGCSDRRSPCACIDASWGSAADQSAAKCPSFRLRERLHDALLEGQPKRPWGIALSAEKCRLVVREMPHRAERSRRWFCSCGCSSRRSPCACFRTCACTYTCDRTCTDAGSRCRIRRVSKRPGGRVCGISLQTRQCPRLQRVSWGSAADQSAAKCPSFRLRERLHGDTADCAQRGAAFRGQRGALLEGQ